MNLFLQEYTFILHVTWCRNVSKFCVLYGDGPLNNNNNCKYCLRNVNGAFECSLHDIYSLHILQLSPPAGEPAMSNGSSLPTQPTSSGMAAKGNNSSSNMMADNGLSEDAEGVWSQDIDQVCEQLQGSNLSRCNSRLIYYQLSILFCFFRRFTKPLTFTRLADGERLS